MSPWRANTKGKGTAHYVIKMDTALMHMYYTAKVYMTEYYRAELSKRVSVTRRTIEEEIQKRGEKYEVGKYPLFFLFYY